MQNGARAAPIYGADHRMALIRERDDPSRPSLECPPARPPPGTLSRTYSTGRIRAMAIIHRSKVFWLRLGAAGARSPFSLNATTAMSVFVREARWPPNARREMF
ncbi:hypothetical protein DPEC_G00102920 [Dallia pectoralis]|uniref:Uncharacterized protein n=1 Tax=Dallia pectoralis TaxID=75939 RepID=A0ACC2GXD5_DALPE|nr:hypothetical protein DPEC_G00102920 [Dallia pectoralis]